MARLVIAVVDGVVPYLTYRFVLDLGGFFCLDGAMTVYEWLGSQLTEVTLVGRFGLRAIYSIILAAAWELMEPKRR